MEGRVPPHARMASEKILPPVSGRNPNCVCYDRYLHVCGTGKGTHMAKSNTRPMCCLLEPSRPEQDGHEPRTSQQSQDRLLHPAESTLPTWARRGTSATARFLRPAQACAVADEQVEAALFKRACGFEYVETAGARWTGWKHRGAWSPPRRR